MLSNGEDPNTIIIITNLKQKLQSVYQSITQ